MATYPIESSDEGGMVDAVNYLLSGPSGLGQNFQGVAAYKPTYLTGFYRKPFTVTTDTIQPATWNSNWPPRWYSTPINITNAYPIDVDPDTNKTFYFKVEFTPQSVPPFMPGQAVNVEGVIDSDGAGFYDYNYEVPGCQYCTTDSVIIKTGSAYEYPTYVSGGTVNVNITNKVESTDCNARVTISGGSDTVFVTSQNQFTIGYECVTSTDFTVTIQVNRYYAFIDTTDPTNPDYRFSLDDRDGRDPTISLQTQTWSITPGTGTLVSDQFIFSTILDQGIPKGFYWYITEVKCRPTVLGDAFVTTIETGLRSLTAQVIKQ